MPQTDLDLPPRACRGFRGVQGPAWKGSLTSKLAKGSCYTNVGPEDARCQLPSSSVRALKACWCRKFHSLYEAFGWHNHFFFLKMHGINFWQQSYAPQVKAIT
eukprot:1153961-Pelagomonas_calceolata.AAC.8